MDPVRAKAISIVLLHFWPLFCQRAVCHDSPSLSLPLSLPFSPPVSLSFPCLWHSFYSAVCQSRQQMQWKAKAEPLPDFYSLSLPPPPSSSPQLVMENLHNTLCNYERDNATSTPLSLTCSLSPSPHADVASVASRLYFWLCRSTRRMRNKFQCDLLMHCANYSYLISYRLPQNTLVTYTHLTPYSQIISHHLACFV